MINLNLSDYVNVNENGDYVFGIRCQICGKVHEITLTKEEADIMDNCYKLRKPVATYFLHKDAVFREKLITGMCDECQKKMFGPYDEDDE